MSINPAVEAISRPYRYVKRVHALGFKHKRSFNNPCNGIGTDARTTVLRYRWALCGQTAYCKEVEPAIYHDQFGPVPFVSWRKSDMVTCQLCLKALRK